MNKKYIIICVCILFFLVSCNNVIEQPKLEIFENIVFEDKEVEYDGKYHSIYVSNAPEFANITYEGNGQKEIGVYIIKATIEAENYETCVVSATLRIVAPIKEFENIVFEDKEVEYDGKYHSIVVQGDLPEGTIITYRDVNNGSKQNTFKEVGEYYIEAKIECEFYTTLCLYARLKIVQIPIIGIVDGKEAFRIDETLKYDDFLSALKKHNFQCYVENGSRQEYADGQVVYTPSSYHTIAVSENAFYVYNDYIDEDEYIYDTMKFAEIVNDQVLITEVKVKDNSVTYYKIPAEGFYETFAAYYIQAPFAHLSKKLDGGFEPKDVPSYYTWYSDYEINDGKFDLVINNYIFHPEFTNSEVTKFVYSNIGNIQINIPKEYKGSYEDLDSYKIHNITLNGIEYIYNGNTWKASIDLSFYDVVLVEPKEIIILASIYDKKVETIFYPYYVYNKNYEGYKFNVYFKS